MTRIKEFKDYYKILNISDSANQEEIKKSFRKLALELHPDHNPNDLRSEEIFKEITEAYGVLSDPKKKLEYDRFRADHLAGRSSSRFQYSQEDIFSSMFQGKNASDMFEELNREFSRSGFRSGNNFFETVFFWRGCRRSRTNPQDGSWSDWAHWHGNQTGSSRRNLSLRPS